MLSTSDLLSIKKKPSEKDISLQTLQTFYKENLCDRVFIFELDDPDRPVIKIRFHENHLCHLLGIQYVVKKLKNKSEYSGAKGYQKLENGTLTIDFLKQTNNTWYKSKKNRMLYFPFVLQVVSNPTVIVFSDENLQTKLDFDIILYNHTDNTYLHLGLDKTSGSEFYYPKSFYEQKKDDHINGRKQLTIESIKVELD
jgi:hypothetical protein